MMSRIVLVGVKGFEPPAPCSQSTCATRLRYTPLKERPAQATLSIIFKLRQVVNDYEYMIKEKSNWFFKREKLG